MNWGLVHQGPLVGQLVSDLVGSRVVHVSNLHLVFSECAIVATLRRPEVEKGILLVGHSSLDRMPILEGRERRYFPRVDSIGCQNEM